MPRISVFISTISSFSDFPLVQTESHIGIVKVLWFDDPSTLQHSICLALRCARGKKQSGDVKVNVCFKLLQQLVLEVSYIKQLDHTWTSDRRRDDDFPTTGAHEPQMPASRIRNFNQPYVIKLMHLQTHLYVLIWLQTEVFTFMYNNWLS